MNLIIKFVFFKIIQNLIVRCAITIGRIIEYLGMNEKIKASVDFKVILNF